MTTRLPLCLTVAPLVLLVLSSFDQSRPPTTPAFDAWATGVTLRVGLYHGGSAPEAERFALASLREEGQWAGSRTTLSDTLNLGSYLIVVYDSQSHLPLYSRGFSSSYSGSSEWSATTDYVRIPKPRRPFQLAVKRRHKDNVGFVDAWSQNIDPSSPSIDRSPLTSRATAIPIMENGDPSTKVDLAILGDGYSVSDRQKFEGDARRAIRYLFDAEPFKSRKAAFNARAVFVASEDSGVTSPLDSRWRRTAFGTSYNSRNVERRLDTMNDVAVREAAAIVPYDFLIVLTNSTRYGGSALYQRFSVVAADSALSPYLVVHEFGHHFAGLEDEYYTLAECNRVPRVEPWEPNVTTTRNRQLLKWKELISKDTDVPTRWPKDEYEKADRAFAEQYFALRKASAPEADVERFIETAIAANRAILARQSAELVGAFEGAADEACGLFRAQQDCTMFTLVPDRFCAVCRRAIGHMIDFYAQ